MKIKCVDSRVNVNIFASTSVPFILTTVQVPNLELTHKKWITVYIGENRPTAEKQRQKLTNGRAEKLEKNSDACGFRNTT